MKTLVIVISLLVPSGLVFAEAAARCNPADSMLIWYRGSGDQSQYLNDPNDINSWKTNFIVKDVDFYPVGNPPRHNVKCVGTPFNALETLTQPEIDNRETTQQAAAEQFLKDSAEASIDAGSVEGKRLRCSLREVLKEINRQVQNLLAPRTAAEIKTAIKQCIRDGND